MLVCFQEGSYLHYGCRSLLCHVVDSVLVSKPIRSLHCVIEMPPPVILLHVPQSRINPTLLTKVSLNIMHVYLMAQD